MTPETGGSAMVSSTPRLVGASSRYGFGAYEQRKSGTKLGFRPQWDGEVKTPHTPPCAPTPGIHRSPSAPIEGGWCSSGQQHQPTSLRPTTDGQNPLPPASPSTAPETREVAMTVGDARGQVTDNGTLRTFRLAPEVSPQRSRNASVRRNTSMVSPLNSLKGELASGIKLKRNPSAPEAMSGYYHASKFPLLATPGHEGRGQLAAGATNCSAGKGRDPRSKVNFNIWKSLFSPRNKKTKELKACETTADRQENEEKQPICEPGSETRDAEDECVPLLKMREEITCCSGRQNVEAFEKKRNAEKFLPLVTNRPANNNALTQRINPDEFVSVITDTETVLMGSQTSTFDACSGVSPYSYYSPSDNRDFAAFKPLVPLFQDNQTLDFLDHDVE
ncbi:hypothetical protein TRVL_01165 [Trypanosoma vivax]|nr:hypothetical protein TRVL_01165 [Trypanosoma vivax]